MRNPASERCGLGGRQQVQEASSNGSTLYCMLPQEKRLSSGHYFITTTCNNPFPVRLSADRIKINSLKCNGIFLYSYLISILSKS